MNLILFQVGSKVTCIAIERIGPCLFNQTLRIVMKQSDIHGTLVRRVVLLGGVLDFQNLTSNFVVGDFKQRFALRRALMK